MLLPNLLSNLLCSLFATFCLSSDPSIPLQPIIENSVPPKEIVVIQSSENNENYFSSNEEGIISKTDLEGIVDFDGSSFELGTSTIVLAMNITEAMVETINYIQSFAAAPVVYAPKDFAPVDSVGDQYAKWVETAWINTVASTNIDNRATITIEDVIERIQDATSSPEATIPIIIVTSTPTAILHIVINAISIGTASSTLDEFVEIYNPTADLVSLDGWKLKRVTASGKTENYLVRPFPSDMSIASKQHFLIAHPSGYSTTTNRAAPDLFYTTASSIAPSNTIILFNGQGEVVDLVGFGEATQFEGAPAFELSNDGQALARTEAIDTDNNSVDFKLISR